jgi:predicted Zn-ribbon and HTH transcriptional regulator
MISWCIPPAGTPRTHIVALVQQQDPDATIDHERRVIVLSKPLVYTPGATYYGGYSGVEEPRIAPRRYTPLILARRILQRLYKRLVYKPAPPPAGCALWYTPEDLALAVTVYCPKCKATSPWSTSIQKGFYHKSNCKDAQLVYIDTLGSPERERPHIQEPVQLPPLELEIEIDSEPMQQGFDRIRDAIRRARGGDPPATPRGYA